MITFPAPSPLSKKLLLYGLGAAAATSAQATVVSTTNIEATGNAFYLDLSGNTYSTTLQSTDQFGFTSNTAQLAAYGGKVNNSFLAEIGAQSVTNGNGTNVSYVLKLSAGTTIGSNLGYSSNSTPSTFDAQTSTTGGTGTNSGFWKPGDRGFVGLSIPSAGSSLFPTYGWADITLNNLDGSGTGTFTLHGFAYQDDGTALAAGSTVPEPSAVALLVAGAAGVGMMRARQRRQAAALAA